mgnify:CR=1 FL=1
MVVVRGFILHRIGWCDRNLVLRLGVLTTSMAILTISVLILTISVVILTISVVILTSH